MDPQATWDQLLCAYADGDWANPWCASMMTYPPR
jgi:hypothetical protein